MASTTETGSTAQHDNSSDSNNFQVEKNLRNRDEFYKETYRFFDALGRHRNLVLAGSAALIGVCIIGGIVANRHEAKSEVARDALFASTKSYETELKALAGVKPSMPEAPAAGKVDPKVKQAADEAKRALDEASNKKMEELTFAKFDVDTKFSATTKKYQEVITQFDGTRSAHEAQMSLGTLYFNHGAAAKAVPLFQAASQSASGSFEKALAFQSLGYALENDGKFAEAVPAYEKALNFGEGSIKGDVLLAIARSHEALHDTAKARSTYDQIISQLSNTEASKTAESLKAKLQ